MFEQINSTRKKLTSYDLVKNYLLSKIYNSYNREYGTKQGDWFKVKIEKFEKIFGVLKDKNKRINFIRHFVSSKTFTLVNKDNNKRNNIYEEVKKIAENDKYFINIQKVFNSLYEYGIIYNFLMNWDNGKYKYDFTSLKIIGKEFGTYVTIIIDIFANNVSIHDGIINFGESHFKEIKNSLLVIEIYIIRRLFCSYSGNTITRHMPLIPKLVRQVDENFL